MSLNQEQIDFWNGPSGQRWVEHQAALDRALRPFGEAAIARARLGEGDRVLDVGCGCGDTTLELAAQVGPDGRVSGLDVSRSMLDVARRRAHGMDNVSFVEADAAEHDLGASFDVIFSRFGVMFFADPARAFAQLRRALAPGGRLSAVVWQAYEKNPWCVVPVEVVRTVLPEAQLPAGDAPGPFAFADPIRLEKLLAGAGFDAISIEPFEANVVFSASGIDEAVRFALTAGPAARLLQQASDEVLVTVRARMAEALAPHVSSARVALGSSSFIATARTPTA